MDDLFQAPMIRGDAGCPKAGENFSIVRGPHPRHTAGMNARSLLTLCISIAALSPAIGGLVSRDNPKPESVAERPRTTEEAVPAPRTAAADKPSRGDLGQEKVLLNRLLSELQRSSRSFIYLRSVGFTQTDKEFEQLIATNDAIFRRTRIVRRDEQGNRQIPGWPGVSLTPEYKSQRR